MAGRKHSREGSVEFSSPIQPVKKHKKVSRMSGVDFTDELCDDAIDVLVQATLPSELTLWRKTSHFLNDGDFTCPNEIESLLLRCYYIY